MVDLRFRYALLCATTRRFALSCVTSVSRPRTGQLREQRQARRVVEDAVGREEWGVDVDRTRGDPEVVGVRAVGQRMANQAAGMAHRGSFGQQRVADGHDGRRGDRFFEPVASRLAPFGDERAVAQFADGDSGQEQLVARQRDRTFVSRVLRRARLSAALKTPVSTRTLTR